MRTESRSAIALMIWIGVCRAAMAQQFAFFGVGTADSQVSPFSTVNGISQTGVTVAGTTTSGTISNVAFIWTIDDGMTLLEPPAPYFLSTGAGVANDEQTVAGNLFDFVQDPDLFRRTELTGVVPIVPTPTFDGATVFAISDNSTTIVGQGNRPNMFGQFEAFRWTEATGIVPLGDLNFQNIFMSSAQAVSASGGTVVGFALNTALNQEGFIRTPSDGNRGLGLLPGEICCESAAFGISSGADFVVGESDSTVEGGMQTKEATLWSGLLLTAEGLGFFIDATSTTALDVSADGSVIVGTGVTNRGNVAFIWEDGVGMRNLETVLSDAGLNFAGWFLEEAIGVSDDGTVICGNGTHNGVQEAWVVVRLPAPPEITMQPASLNVAEGDQAMFSVIATASEAPTFQWRREGVNLVDGGRISGALTDSLTIDNAMTSDFGVYDVVVSIPESQTVSDPAALCVQMGPDVPPSPPTLDMHPQSQVVTQGDNVLMSVGVESSPMMPTFQWRKSGVDLTDGPEISGATADQLSLTNVQASDFGAYDCVVSSGDASVTSNPAALCVLAPDAPFCVGDADDNGLVEFADITAVLNNWLVVCPSN